MRREVVKQSGVVGQHYEVGPRSVWLGPAADSPEGVNAQRQHAMWTVAACDEAGATSACDYVFVDWTDHIRGHWPKSAWQVWVESLRTYAAVWKNRKLLAPLHQETPYVLWTLFYPLAYALLCVVLAIGFGGLVAWAFTEPTPNSIPSGAFLGLGATVLVLLGGYQLDKRLHVSWLLRILNFARRSGQQPPDVVQQRFKQLADGVVQQVQAGTYQEVLVVGFSVGSTLAVSLVQVLRESFQQAAAKPQQLNLLTLGNCIPLFSLMPQSNEALHQNLLALAQDEHLHWVDISAPSDSVSFGMCDLVALSLPHAQASDLQRCVNPRHMCSPRFHKLFQPSTYRWLRRNKMRMHFQYLMASELPGAYDYFALLTCQGAWMDFISKRLVR